MGEFTGFRIETYTKKGDGQLNEDALVVNEAFGIYGVVDGATSLTAYRSPDGFTGGYLAAQLAAGAFESIAEQQPLQQTAIQANQDLFEKMKENVVEVTDPSALWSAALVIVSIHAHNIEYVQAGDCMLFAKYRDGSLRIVTHPQVAHLDQVTLNRMIELRNIGGLDQAGIRRQLLPIFQENRAKANTLDGYGVMNGSPGFADFLEQGTFNRANLETLYLMSDGLFTGVEEWPALIKHIDEYGLRDYIEQLDKLEQADDSCIRFPRLKGSDDKTGIVIHFS